MKEFGFHLSLTHQNDGDGIFGFKATTSNGRFSGSVTWWGYIDNILLLAQQLKGFPSAHDETVVLRFDESCVLTFECIDRLGHVIVNACLKTINGVVLNDKTNQSVALILKTDLAAIDTFSSSLTAIGNNKDQCASLEAAP